MATVRAGVIFFSVAAAALAVPVAAQLVVLGLLFNLSGTTVNLLVGVMAARAGAGLRARLGATGTLRRATGLIFLGLGLRLALDRR